MSENQSVATLPTERSCPFDPPQELKRLREEEPMSRLAFPDGTVGWLATRQADVRAVLADPRFSVFHARHSSPIRATPPELRGPVPPGCFIQMDDPEHGRYRRLLTGQFTVRRIRQLIPRVEEVTAEYLDAMERDGGPVDLLEAFALPITGQMICDLLGVPFTDRAYFQRLSGTMMSSEDPLPVVQAAAIEMWDFMLKLVRGKRTEPGDDIISGLTTSGAELSDDEIAGIGVPLLLAGYDSTANMLALGAFALLGNPGQIAPLLEDDPGAHERLVEELLRYLTIVQFGTIRCAMEDVEIGGVLVREGEIVSGSLAMANRDPEHFTDPETLDVKRERNQHNAFGHGVHQCLGQQLARIVLGVGYRDLFRRFPSLRLAVAPEEIRLLDDKVMYGVHELPVTWSGDNEPRS